MQLNRLVHEIRQTMVNSKTKILLRDMQASFCNFDTKGAGIVHLDNFVAVLQEHRVLLKQWEYQVFLKAFGVGDSSYLAWDRVLQALALPLCP